MTCLPSGVCPPIALTRPRIVLSSMSSTMTGVGMSGACARGRQGYDEAWHAVVQYSIGAGTDLYLDLSADRVRQADSALEALDGARLPPGPDVAPRWT